MRDEQKRKCDSFIWDCSVPMLVNNNCQSANLTPTSGDNQELGDQRGSEGNHVVGSRAL